MVPVLLALLTGTAAGSGWLAPGAAFAKDGDSGGSGSSGGGSDSGGSGGSGSSGGSNSGSGSSSGGDDGGGRGRGGDDGGGRGRGGDDGGGRGRGGDDGGGRGRGGDDGSGRGADDQGRRAARGGPGGQGGQGGIGDFLSSIFGGRGDDGRKAEPSRGRADRDRADRDRDRGNGRGDQDVARDAVARGQAVPFDRVIGTVRQAMPGEILDVKVGRSSAGLTYNVTVLARDGWYREVVVDARRNRVLEVR